MTTKKRTVSELYISNLRTTRTKTAITPTTEFPGGARFYLKWDSNGTEFEVYNKNNTTPIYTGNEKTILIDHRLYTNSTLVVRAKLNGKVMYASITVTISYPDLTPKSVVTTTSETVNGSLTVRGTSTLKNTTVDGTLNVTGTSNFKEVSTAAITVGKKLTEINTKGEVTTEKLTVNGATTIKGEFSTESTVTLEKNCLAKGDSRVNGKFSTYGDVWIFNSGTLIGSGPTIDQLLKAKSDGILVVHIESSKNLGEFSLAWGSVYYSGRWFSVTGGISSEYRNNWTRVWTNPNTFSIPIAATNTFRITGFNCHTEISTIYFYWFPIGKSSTKPEPVIDLAHESYSTSPLFEVNKEEMTTKRKNKALEIVSLFEKATDKIFDAAVKEQLASELLKL